MQKALTCCLDVVENVVEAGFSVHKRHVGTRFTLCSSRRSSSGVVVMMVDAGVGLAFGLRNAARRRRS